jgi:hypothetical protein
VARRGRFFERETIRETLRVAHGASSSRHEPTNPSLTSLSKRTHARASIAFGLSSRRAYAVSVFLLVVQFFVDPPLRRSSDGGQELRGDRV